jgi:hypothetical protein
MVKHIQPPKFGTIYQSKSKMLEDVRLLLGLTQEELVSALNLLEKVDYGSLLFDRDSTSRKTTLNIPLNIKALGQCSKF